MCPMAEGTREGAEPSILRSIVRCKKKDECRFSSCHPSPDRQNSKVTQRTTKCPQGALNALSLSPQLPRSPSPVPCVSGHSVSQSSARSSIRSCVSFLPKQWRHERSTLIASRSFCLSLPLLSVSRRIHPGFQQQCMQCSRSSQVAERIHVCNWQPGSQSDRQTGSQANRQANRQAGRQRHKRSDRPKKRYRDKTIGAFDRSERQEKRKNASSKRSG